MSILLPLVANATTYYVSTTGSNSNNGTDTTTPFLTVAYCANLMVAGDTCLIRAGTYTESGGVRIGRSGTASLPIRLANYPGEAPHIAFPSQSTANRILVQNLSGSNVAIGYITIEGLEVSGGWEGIKFINMHNSIIRNMRIHDGHASGIFGGGGHHNLFERNIIHHQGNWAECAAGTANCNQDHGMYMHGDSYIIRHNLIYDNIGAGIQQNGSPTSSYTTTRHPSVEFSGARNWVIADNTFAYQAYVAGVVIWNALTSNTRVENNIFYENRVIGTSAQGMFFTGVAGTNITLKNNHCYASGSGGTACIGGTLTPGGTQASVEGVNYTQSGNVVNVSAPAFVNGGSNSLPASPDFRLTASAPVNIALANEFPNNSTSVVGAYKTIGACTASITTNKITVVCPLSTATPIQNLSLSGVFVGCTGTSCPGSHTVSSVSRVIGSTTQVEIVISGISGDACVSTNQNWTLSYDAGLGTWSGNDNIGVYPGIHQKLFSFTSLSVTNSCTGSGPTTYPSGYHIYYKFNEGSGINANDESANSLDCTLTNGPTWGSGKSGYGLVITGNNTEHCAIPYGSDINPSAQSLTIAFGVNIQAGNETLSRQYFGAPLGTSQRLYISTAGSTWRIGIQGSSDATAGNIAVTTGWHNVCLVMDSGADTATLYIDGVASTSAGGVKSYTSYTLSGDFDLGRIADIDTGGGGGTYDDFLLYTSVKDCAAISAAFSAGASTPSGTFAQEAIQFQGVILDPSSTPIVIGPAVQTVEVPAGGGIVLVFQVHCQNISNCDPTSFKLTYTKNGASTWVQIPAIDSDGTWMWGESSESHMNTGVRSTCLTGSCTVTNGTTQVVPGATPTVDLPQDGRTVMAYIVKVGSSQAGNYFDYKLQFEAGVDFPVYTQIARIIVVNPMASGIGF